MKFFRKLFAGSAAKASETMREVPEDLDRQGIRLVVGLGNPGLEYAHTRHNVGFDLVERVAADLGLEWEKDRKSRALVARKGAEIILVKPQTYMNLSGESVVRLTGFYKVPKDGLLVVYDDVDTPLGTFRIKPKGSAGGHNGMKSIIQCLGHDQFARLKIGIGATEGRRDMVDHVLGKFSPAERDLIEKSLADGVESVKYALANGLNSAMNHFNQSERAKKTTTLTKKSTDKKTDNETEISRGDRPEHAGPGKQS